MKIIKVENCSFCPWFRRNENGKKLCGAEEQDSDGYGIDLTINIEKNVIPLWCMLEDA